MEESRLAQQVRFIVEVDKLKEIFRQTLLIGSRRAENDAEHSWHLCLIAIVLAEHAADPSLDLLRVLKMLIVHDLVEIDAGDTFAYDTARMADQRDELRALWDEFEEKRTPEAKFATAVDRFQPMLLNVRTQGAAWNRHGVTSDRVVARNRHIAEGSPALWEFASAMIADAVKRGELAP